METELNFFVGNDVSRNLIVIRYEGSVTAAEVSVVYDRVMSMLPHMRKGFALLADLSKLDSMDLDCMTDLTRIMDACNAAGIELVVRIIPDPKKDIGLNILSIIHYRRGVRIVTCR